VTYRLAHDGYGYGFWFVLVVASPWPAGLVFERVLLMGFERANPAGCSLTLARDFFISVNSFRTHS
jgi:hypothetical protein